MTVRVITAEHFNSDPDINGPSPGGAASYAGVSRQAIHQAIREGRLDAWVVTDQGAPWGRMTIRSLTPKPIKHVVGIYVDERSLELYAASCRRRNVS